MSLEMEPNNRDPRNRMSPDDELDELMSKRRTKWPSSWVVAKSAPVQAVVKPAPDEEELKKQRELDLKTIALRQKFGVKKKVVPGSNPNPLPDDKASTPPTRFLNQLQWQFRYPRP